MSSVMAEIIRGGDWWAAADLYEERGWDTLAGACRPQTVPNHWCRSLRFGELATVYSLETAMFGAGLVGSCWSVESYAAHLARSPGLVHVIEWRESARPHDTIPRSHMIRGAVAYSVSRDSLRIEHLCVDPANLWALDTLVAWVVELARRALVPWVLTAERVIFPTWQRFGFTRAGFVRERLWYRLAVS